MSIKLFYIRRLFCETLYAHIEAYKDICKGLCESLISTAEHVYLLPNMVKRAAGYSGGVPRVRIKQLQDPEQQLVRQIQQTRLHKFNAAESWGSKNLSNQLLTYLLAQDSSAGARGR